MKTFRVWFALCLIGLLSLSGCATCPMPLADDDKAFLEAVTMNPESDK